jgi:hypothetical protein
MRQINIFSPESHALIRKHVDEFKFTDEEMKTAVHLPCDWEYTSTLSGPPSAWGWRAVALRHMHLKHPEYLEALGPKCYRCNERIPEGYTIAIHLDSYCRGLAEEQVNIALGLIES